ncbi:hypothetical protein [Crossiella sp. CA198]|uniref:hypothetical protein n=1 Tax=Crossiella sp. CA198 TaxID=3455607 RepID=UPI003F8CF2B0
MFRIQVARSQCNGSTAAAGGFDMQPEQNSVQDRVISGCGRNGVDLSEACVLQAVSPAWLLAWFLDLERRIIVPAHQFVVDEMSI